MHGHEYGRTSEFSKVRSPLGARAARPSADPFPVGQGSDFLMR